MIWSDWSPHPECETRLACVTLRVDVSRPSKRKPRPAGSDRRRCSSGPTRPTGTPSPTTIFEAALRGVRGIHAVDEPIEVESFVSDLLGNFDQPLIDIDDSVDFLGQQLVRFLITKRSPDALAVLHGIAAIADEPLASSARQGVVRLRAAGRDDPPFAARLGAYRFVGAWVSIDEYGDQEMVAMSFADAADHPHVVAVMIDHNFDGLVREALLGPDLDALRRTWAETSSMTIVDIDAQGAADRLGQGLRMYDVYLDPPVSDDVRELAMLMKARLRALPEARERDWLEVPDDERALVVAGFATAREARGSRDAVGWARWFVDYRFDSTDGDPLRWSPIAVELCLVDWFPRKATLDDESIAEVPDALRRFVRYAGRKKGLSPVSIKETLDAIDEFEPDYLAAMREPASFGPAKSLVDQMLSDGVELTDDRAVQAWIEALNARPFDERVEILGPPVGHGGITLDRAPVSRRLDVLPGGRKTPGTRRQR